MVSLTLTFCCTLFQIFLTLNDGIYSLISCFQYISDRLSTTFCLRWLSISFSFISTIPYAFKDSPDIKWFGANKVKSSVSSLIDIKGWLLIVPSIWKRVVINWSSCIGWLCVTDFNAFFITFTNDSQAPPFYELLCALKCYWVFRIDKFLANSVWSKLFS